MTCCGTRVLKSANATILARRDGVWGLRMNAPPETGDSARFDLNEFARSFPESAQTLLLDTYLTNEPAASARVFKVYRGTPPHYHATCGEYLLVLSGKGTFWMGEAGGFRARPPAVLQARRRPFVAADHRSSGRVLLSRHAETRSKRHYFRQSRRWDAGKLRAKQRSMTVRLNRSVTAR